MGRNIFNQMQPPAPSEPKPQAKALRAAGSVGGLRDSLREMTANSIRDIDPAHILQDGPQDRLSVEDSGIAELAESIRQHGQQVPIMVRPADQPDRYRVVYGRRRLAALRMIGEKVKAIVRTLDDTESLIAQGQENNLRLDPSFIEKALFIRDMQASGYKPGVIQDALGLTRQGVSNHRVVIDQVPEAVVRLIGPAHGVGRRQWADLGALAGKIDLEQVARETLGDAQPDSAERFKAVLAAAKRRTRPTAEPVHRGGQTEVLEPSGTRIGSARSDAKAVSLTLHRKDQPDFADWVSENAETVLRMVHDHWNKSRAGSE